MRRLVSGLLATALVATAGGASAQPASGSSFFRLFSTVCVPHPNDWKAAAAEAGKLGFEPVSIPGRTSPDQAWSGAFGGQTFVLTIGGGPSSGEGPPTAVSRCQVLSPLRDSGELQEVRTWVGLPLSHKFDGGAAVYIFRDGPSGRAQIKLGEGFEEARAAAERAGEIRIVMIHQLEAGFSVMLSGARPQ